MRSARRRTPNLLNRFETWNFTVRSAIFAQLIIFEELALSEQSWSIREFLRGTEARPDHIVRCTKAPNL
jgi:hypothetical protein